MENNTLELDHIIGYNGQYLNTVIYHPFLKDTMIYNIGSLVIIEPVADKHNQAFLRGHDMEISVIELSHSGKMLATGQKGSAFLKTPDAPVILWDFEKKSPIFMLKGLQGCVRYLKFSEDDRFLAAYGTCFFTILRIGDNNVLIIWDCRDGSAVHTRIFEFPLTLRIL